MTLLERPPRPRFAVRLGVIGHRPNRLDASATARIETQCRDVITVIREAAAPAQNPLIYSPQPPRLRIVSPLAEGADRIFAEVGLALGCELECPLPFPAADYERDFSSPESLAEFRALLARAGAVLELDGARDDQEAAYEAAGRTVIGHCDVLIVIWDGGPAAGRGGTTQLLAEALARRYPVVWINAVNAAEPRLLLRGSAEETIEKPLLDLAPYLVARLGVPAGSEADDREAASGYFAERRPSFDAGQFFAVFRDLVAFGRWRRLAWRTTDYATAARDAWDRELARIPDLPEPLQRYVLDRLSPHFAWADGLSDHYAGLYRSSYVANNLLSALAVLIGLSGLIWELMLLRPVGKGGTFVEVLLIATILITTFLGRRRRWHARWLDYRQLAEQLRQLRYLGPLACATPAPHLPAYLGAESGSWVDGLFRAILRDLGLAQGGMGKTYRAALAAWLNEVIIGQIAYHNDNADMMTRLDRHLHRVGRGLFWATLFCCVVRLFVGGLDLSLVGAAIFPALGAAFYAIRNHGEFHRTADRSRAMGRELAALGQELLAARAEEAPSLARLQQLASRAAEIMLAETIDWRVVFRYRPLGLPG